MDKYQESLNYICSFLSNLRVGRGNGKSQYLTKLNDSISTLQKLIISHTSLLQHIEDIENNNMEDDEKWETLISILEGDE